VDFISCSIAVANNQFRALGMEGVKAFAEENHVIYDIKYLYGAKDVDGRL